MTLLNFSEVYGRRGEGEKALRSAQQTARKSASVVYRGENYSRLTRIEPSPSENGVCVCVCVCVRAFMLYVLTFDNMYL